MRIITIVFILLFIINGMMAQETNTAASRSIQVTGSAEMEVEPDEIRFIIGIEEYWLEEFDKNKEFKDYETRVPIEEIEAELMKELSDLGFGEDKIIMLEAGNYWRSRGKEFLRQKRYELTLDDVSQINLLTSQLETLGISYMRIGQLKNSNITEYRKQVKIEALKAAMEKGTYLLESIGKRLGEVISITEVDGDRNYYWRSQSAQSNTMMNSGDDGGVDNIRKIRLRYEVRASFEIAD